LASVGLQPIATESVVLELALRAHGPMNVLRAVTTDARIGHG